MSRIGKLPIDLSFGLSKTIVLPKTSSILFFTKLCKKDLFKIVLFVDYANLDESL